MKIKRSATTLIEVIIAITIGVAVLIPLGTFFSQSGKQVTKAQNYILAMSLARRIIRHINLIPYTQLKTKFPEIETLDDFHPIQIGERDNDLFFGEMYNFKDNKKGIKHLNQNDMLDFYKFLSRYDFRYIVTSKEAPSVGNSSFGSITTITVGIFWKENGKDYTYTSHAFAIP